MGRGQEGEGQCVSHHCPPSHLCIISGVALSLLCLSVPRREERNPPGNGWLSLLPALSWEVAVLGNLPLQLILGAGLSGSRSEAAWLVV